MILFMIARCDCGKTIRLKDYHAHNELECPIFGQQVAQALGKTLVKDAKP